MAAGRSRAQSLIRVSHGTWISLGLIVASAVAAFGFDARAGEMRDFEVYWTAAGRAAAGEPLYRAADGHFQFKYLPAFAVACAPLALLPLEVAKSFWFVCSVTLIPALVALSIALVPKRQRGKGVLAVVVVIAMAKFFGHELVLGQVNLLFAVLAASGILLLAGRRNLASGLAFTAAVVVKPYAVIFVPWLAWIRRVALCAMGVGGLLVAALPVPFYGFRGTVDLHLAWWRTVTDSTAPNLTNPDNVSLAAFFAKWLGVGSAASIAASIAAIALLLAVAWVLRSSRGVVEREPLDGALLLTTIPLLSPQGWDYVFLVAAPAVALFANYDRQLPHALRVATWTALAVIAFSLFDLLGRQRYATFMSWSVITVCFLILIAALSALRLRRIA